MKTKILFVLPAIPYPAITGAKLRTYSFINALCEDNELSLLCMRESSNDDDNEIAGKLNKIFKNIWKVNELKESSKKTGVFNSLLGILASKSWEIQDYNTSFETKLLDILKKNNYDFIFCRYIDMAKYILNNRMEINSRIIVDLDDIEPIKKKRQLEQYTTKKNYFYYRSLLNNYFFSKYHKKLKYTTNCIVCSDKDKKHVKRKRWSKNISVIPNSIDAKRYVSISPFSQETLNNKIFLCCGNLSYKPNSDGLVWFVEHVWPHVLVREPEAKLFMVGKDPDKSLYDFVDNNSIFLYPNVESVIPYYEKASISIVPLHVAGGTRIKILESFSANRPVISTSIGAEGLNVTSGKHCLIADKALLFSDLCVRTLNDYPLAKSLTENSYKLVSEKYDASKIKKSISKLFTL